MNAQCQHVVVDCLEMPTLLSTGHKAVSNHLYDYKQLGSICVPQFLHDSRVVLKQINVFFQSYTLIA